MRCPFCGNVDTAVKDSRPSEDNTSIRRRRQCPACSGRFTTFERIQLRELTVIKSNGTREPFDRDKLAKSLIIALHKRPVESERIERIVSSIVRRLEHGGEADIQTREIGEMVMLALSELDQVGFVRFASVYRNFEVAEEFQKILDEMDDSNE